MINQRDMMAVVDRLLGDAVVISVATGTRAWTEVSRRPERHVPIQVMGKASSFALGLALAQPGLKVILFDGDGGLLMNLGSLVTIAGKAPPNLYHFVLENGVYATTGGQPLPGQGRFCLASLAREAGYAASYEFDDLEEFTTSAERMLNERGPVFICIKTVPEIQNEPIGRRPRLRRIPAQAIAELRQSLGTV